MSKRRAATSDDARAIRRVMEFMAIPGKSGEELQAVDYVRKQLIRAGASESWIRTDAAHRRSPLGGQVGNLVCKLPGSRREPRRLLVAHLDTVPICVGSRPLRKGGRVVAADPKTGLGGDDRAGSAVLLATALRLLERDRAHPPLTFLWTVQEESGLSGVRNLRQSLLGRPRRAFNFDGGSPCKLTIGATGASRVRIDVHGVASHAGVAPEEGISAIAIAATAIAELHAAGWHGLVQQNGKIGTTNVGVIQGGDATNVVTDHVRVRAEARSHDPRFRKRIVAEIEKAFRRAVKAVKSADGRHGRVDFEARKDYDAYKLPLNDPSVQAAARAVTAEGGEVDYAVANGGLDANWITAYGIPCVSLGCGQRNIHTVNEELDLGDFLLAQRIALRLASDPEA